MQLNLYMSRYLRSYTYCMRNATSFYTAKEQYRRSPKPHEEGRFSGTKVQPAFGATHDEQTNKASRNAKLSLSSFNNETGAKEPSRLRNRIKHVSISHHARLPCSTADEACLRHQGSTCKSLPSSSLILVHQLHVRRLQRRWPRQSISSLI